jgi:hypothetical protein
MLLPSRGLTEQEAAGSSDQSIQRLIGRHHVRHTAGVQRRENTQGSAEPCRM